MIDQKDVLRLRVLVKEVSEILSRYEDTIPTPAPTIAPTPAPTLPPVSTKAITSLTIETPENAVPITWGQVFKIGDVKPGDPLMARWKDGSTTELQVDGKARHADGSLRHAVISTIAVDGTMDIVKGSAQTKIGNGQKSIPPFYVKIVLGGVSYMAGGLDDSTRWLDGPIVTEHNASSPFLDKDGKAHPHLHARFAVRCYAGMGSRVDITLENDWAYEPSPQNFTYDVQIAVGDKSVYEQKAVTHYHHARWRKVFWAGRNAPAVNIQHDSRYVIDTRALPNYDHTVEISEKYLSDTYTRWNKIKDQSFGVGLANPYMPATGGREDIGLNPGWAVAWLLSQDSRASEFTLGTADMSGSWSSHYRDKNTDLPVTLTDHPYMTILGGAGDTRNPKTGLREAFPAVNGTTPNKHDTAHQPNLAYIPYLLTGDLYYLEELQFWASWNVLMSNPVWRRAERGLVGDDQVRGQAWSMRTLGEAAYITPDAHPLKAEFNRLLKSNLDWYDEKYSKNKSSNKLGALDMSSAVVYKNKLALAPWQDDFFTAAIGHLVDLGFGEARPLLQWKLQFPIGRMVGDGVCWMVGANYTYDVRQSASGPFFTSMREAYAATVGPERAKMACGSADLAKALGQGINDMGGFSASPEGYPSNMQPALAYAADMGGDEGEKAWQQFMARSVKPDYSTRPQFAIVPRTV